VVEEQAQTLIREPVQVEGDFYSLVACNETGCQRLVEMMEEFDLDDVLNELVSREAAERDYGVVLTAGGAVDEEATNHRRSQGA
jgi:N-methylhydantoinase B/oxoprolinase/acetone carboxylase alpha subunit